MNNKLSALLTSAIVTGLLATTAAKAEESAAGGKSGEAAAAGKEQGCKGEMKLEDKKAAAMTEKGNKCAGKKKHKEMACKGACKGEMKEEQKGK